jgi:hypothetical protein
MAIKQVLSCHFRAKLKVAIMNNILETFQRNRADSLAMSRIFKDLKLKPRPEMLFEKGKRREVATSKWKAI